MAFTSARLDAPNRVMEVTWYGEEHNGRVGKFPITWLRDNCLCSDCFHPSWKMRLYDMAGLDLNILPVDVEISDSKTSIKIMWPDNHVTMFTSDWLMSRDFGSSGHQFNRSRDNPLPLSPRLWRAEMKNELKTFNYKDIINDDRVLFDWLVTMEEVGIARLTDAPPDTRVVERIAARVAHCKTTYYGQTFRVDYSLTPDYSKVYIPLHADLPFFRYVAGVQLLHFIVQPTDETDEGDNSGELEFVDGFTAAEDLRRNDQDAFGILTSVPVDFRIKGDDFYKYDMHYRRPTIEVDENGSVSSVVFHTPSRDSLSHVPLGSVQSLYESLAKLNEFFYDPCNLLEFRVIPGDVMTFHNHRVLHGRKKYKSGIGGALLAMGAYIDWDEMRSRRRVLAEEMTS